MSRTSSNVRPSRATLSSINDITENYIVLLGLQSYKKSAHFRKNFRPIFHKTTCNFSQKHFSFSSQKDSPLFATFMEKSYLCTPEYSGGVAEWSMAAVLKTVGRQRPGGSNPSASASEAAHPRCFFRFGVDEHGNAFKRMMAEKLLGKTSPKVFRPDRSAFRDSLFQAKRDDNFKAFSKTIDKYLKPFADIKQEETALPKKDRDLQDGRFA